MTKKQPGAASARLFFIFCAFLAAPVAKKKEKRHTFREKNGKWQDGSVLLLRNMVESA
jgi:uncharacterized protein YukJ